jgi:hypothetical protein
LLLRDFFEERSQLRRYCVDYAIEPTPDEDVTVLLEFDVLGNIVHDNCTREVVANATQVLHEDRNLRKGMLTIHKVADALALVDLVKDRNLKYHFPKRSLPGGV